jgi:hypothetical protein
MINRVIMVAIIALFARGMKAFGKQEEQVTRTTAGNTKSLSIMRSQFPKKFWLKIKSLGGFSLSIMVEYLRR